MKSLRPISTKIPNPATILRVAEEIAAVNPVVVSKPLNVFIKQGRPAGKNAFVYQYHVA
jgi:hypothetical protein